MTTKELIAKYGDPTKDNLTFERKFMMLWDIPQDINSAIPPLPNKLYCHKEIVVPLEKTFKKLIETGLHTEIKTWDGCFNIRKQRGSSAISVHSWGLAVDINAAWNGLGKPVQFSKDFISIWRNLGWVCGADWAMPRTDGMHFEWTK